MIKISNLILRLAYQAESRREIQVKDRNLIHHYIINASYAIKMMHKPIETNKK